MMFEEIWSQVEDLPDTAKLHVPGALRESTKRQLSRKSPQEVADIVRKAIIEIDEGSVKTVDELVNRYLV